VKDRQQEMMREMAEQMKATGFEPMGMNAAKEKLQRHLDGGIADARDRLRSSAQREVTVLALNVLLNETQKNAMLLVTDNDRLRAANARLQAECDRKQEWIDAVMGELTAARIAGTGDASVTLYGAGFTYGTELIIRPQPLAKE